MRKSEGKKLCVLWHNPLVNFFVIGGHRLSRHASLNDAGMSCVSKLPSLLRLLNEIGHGLGQGVCVA